MSSDTQTERAAEDAERRKQVALFRHSVIGDLVHLEPGHRGMYSLSHEKAAREWDIPGSLRRHIAAETIRGWLRDYQSGGFDALVPKVPADQRRKWTPHENQLLGPPLTLRRRHRTRQNRQH